MTEVKRPLRKNAQAVQVLLALEAGPHSTIELQESYPLVHVARQIWELRHWYGIRIKTRRLPNNVALYELQHG